MVPSMFNKNVHELLFYDLRDPAMLNEQTATNNSAIASGCAVRPEARGCANRLKSAETACTVNNITDML